MCNYWKNRSVDCVWYPMDGMKASGRCIGNDSRCKGKAKPFCEYLADTKVKQWFVNCSWDPWLGEGNVGECLGQSTNCHYQNFPMCKHMSKIGHGDCQWFAGAPRAKSSGECIGNDNVCAGCSKNWCKFHISLKRNCRWYTAQELELSPGRCVGSDPRCTNISKPMCDHITQHRGANCVWDSAAPESTGGLRRLLIV